MNTPKTGAGVAARAKPSSKTMTKITLFAVYRVCEYDPYDNKIPGPAAEFFKSRDEARSRYEEIIEKYHISKDHFRQKREIEQLHKNPTGGKQVRISDSGEIKVVKKVGGENGAPAYWLAMPKNWLSHDRQTGSFGFVHEMFDRKDNQQMRLTRIEITIDYGSKMIESNIGNLNESFLIDRDFDELAAALEDDPMVEIGVQHFGGPIPDYRFYYYRTI